MSGYVDDNHKSDGKDRCIFCGHIAPKGEEVLLEVDGRPGQSWYQRNVFCRKCQPVGGRMVSGIARYESRVAIRKAR